MARYADILQALRNASEAGDKVSAQKLARMIENEQYDEESGALTSATQGIAQGVTFGFADEIGAGLRAAVEPLLGVYDEQKGKYFENFGKRYQQNLRSQRQALETARREDPWLTGAGELAGGLTTGGSGMAKAVAGKTLGAGLRAGALRGAGYGVTAGYGYSNADPIAGYMIARDEGGLGVSAPQQREALKSAVGKAALDAGTGAAVGGALAPAMSVAGVGTRALARGVAKRLPGNQFAAARLKEQARQKVLQAVEEDLAIAGGNKDRLARQLADNPTQAFADTGEATRALGDTLAQTPTPGAHLYRQWLRHRNTTQYRKRLLPKLVAALGGEKGETWNAARKRLQQEARQLGDKYYTEAYRQPMTVDDTLLSFLKSDVGKAGLRNARRIARNQNLGEKPPPIGKPGDPVAMRYLDSILRGMNSEVSKLYRQGKADVADSARVVRDAFRDYLDGLNPAYAKARQTWAGARKNQEALEAGTKIFREDADLVADTVRNMSEGEKVNFRIGALKALTKLMGNKSFSADVTKGIFDRPGKLDALEVAFGGKRNFANFMRTIASEQRQFETFANNLGNSATVRRLAAQQIPGEGVAAAAGYAGGLKTGGVISPTMFAVLARRAYRSVASPRNTQKIALESQAMADMLRSNDMQRLLTPNTYYGLLDSGVPKSAGLLTGGLLGTELPYPTVGRLP